MPEKCFVTEDPDEADELEIRLDDLGIEYHIETEAAESGFPRHTFYVPSNHLLQARNEAKMIRASTLHPEQPVLSPADAVRLLEKDTSDPDPHGYGIRGIAAFALSVARYPLALAAIPLFFPISSYLTSLPLPIHTIHPEDQRRFAVGLSFAIVTTIVSLIIRFIRPLENNRDSRG